MTKQTECLHMNFLADVRVGRLTDGDEGPVTGYSADIKIHCTGCNLPFRFRGLPFGYSPSEPRLSVDATELRAPIEPAYTLEIMGHSLTAGSA